MILFSIENIYSFPNDPECRKLWCEFCWFDTSDTTSQNVRLCSLHFSHDSLIKSGLIGARFRSDLKKGSIPTLISKIDAVNANSLQNIKVKQEVIDVSDDEDLVNLPPVNIRENIECIFIVKSCNDATSVNVQNCVINNFDVRSPDDSASISDQNNTIDVVESPSKGTSFVEQLFEF